MHADEAFRIGLANQIIPTDSFAAVVQEYAAHLAKQAPLALTRGKRAIYAAQQDTFEEALRREAAFQREIFGSEDGWEGFQAFMEKRPPRWRGK